MEMEDARSIHVYKQVKQDVIKTEKRGRKEQNKNLKQNRSKYPSRQKIT